MKITGLFWSIVLLLALSVAKVHGQIASANDGPVKSFVFDQEQHRQGNTISVQSKPLVFQSLPVKGVWEIEQHLINGRTRNFTPEFNYLSHSAIFPGATHWCYLPAQKRLEACQRLYFGKEDARDFIEYLDAAGNVLLKEDPRRYFYASPDTLIEVQVFYPNPVVSRNEPYGKRLRDNEDMNSHWLDSALVTKTLRLLNAEGAVRPATEWFQFSEISAPFRGHPWQNVSPTKLRRGDAHFEFFNVLYHLENAAQIIRRKGYPQLLSKLVFDPHALNDRDQSAFNPYAVPPSLEFGTGGVDDGEDAQVILHEYAHAWSHQAAPHSFSGSERKMIEEGNADFLAMYYSQKLNPNRSHDLFSWDGHNEFWEGVSLSRQENFSQLTQAEIFDGREIWASCLRCIAQATGWEYAAGLVLESLFYQRPEMTLEDMGYDILLIDTLLGEGLRYRGIKNCLLQYGIVQADDRDVPEENAGTGNLINTEGFAYQHQEAYLKLPENMTVFWKICDLTGRELRSEKVFNQKIIPFSGEGLPVGMLMLEVEYYSTEGILQQRQQFRLFKGQ